MSEGHEAPTAAAVPVPQVHPHIGTLLPSGRMVLCCDAVKFTTAWAEAIPAVRSRAVPARIAVLRAFLVMRMISTPGSQRFVNVPNIRVHQHHHQHAAREYVVGGDLALIVGMPHERDAGFRNRVLQRTARRQWRRPAGSEDGFGAEIRRAVVPKTIGDDEWVWQGHGAAASDLPHRIHFERYVVVSAPFIVVRGAAGHHSGRVGRDYR